MHESCAYLRARHTRYQMKKRLGFHLFAAAKERLSHVQGRGQCVVVMFIAHTQHASVIGYMIAANEHAAQCGWESGGCVVGMR